MKTKNIFVDTQAIMAQGFKFENTIMSRISELGRTGKIDIYISEVVDGEVTNKIQEKIKKIHCAKKKFFKELDVLESNVPESLKNAEENYSDDEIFNLGKLKWIDYVEQSNIQVLESNNVCIKDLLSGYFEGNFPFSVGKKKNEFPDAISTLSLLGWLNRNNESTYIVSDDRDLKGFCEEHDRCFSIRTLSGFLDIYNQSEEAVVESLHEYIKLQEDWLRGFVIEAVLESDFSFDSMDDAEVEVISVTSLCISDVKVIKVIGNTCLIDLIIDAELEAHVSGPNYENAIWDSETKQLMVTEMFEGNMQLEFASDVEVGLSFDEKDEELTEVLNILINSEETIDLVSYYEFPYK